MTHNNTVNINEIIKEEMDKEEFNSIMANGYSQAIQGDSYSIDNVFEELEKGL